MITKFKIFEKVLFAPNDRISNLTSIQYKLVRTKAFKKWFGDWENDPENSSKVIDENGEPLVVYHGTDKEFNIFKKISKASKNNILGFWFEINKHNAYLYGNGKYVLNVFLNIRHPKIFNETDWVKQLNYTTWDDNKKMKEQLIQNGYDGIRYNYLDGTPHMFVAFFSNQIKLADGTNISFDKNNPNIRK